MFSAAVANSGTLMKPYLVRRELAPNLSVLAATKPTLLSSALPSAVDTQLADMMRAVIADPEGTGKAADITDQPGVVVYGKTGTADTGVTSASTSEPDSWFTGYATRNGSPKIAVAVVIENSNELKLGGAVSSNSQSAAQVARAVMSAYLGAPGGN
jgi:peptidoglycan glycosyltransferase